MELEDGFAKVVRIARDSTEVESGYRELVDFLSREVGRVVEPLRRVDIRADVESLKRQLVAVLAAEPPPSGLTAWYFGLFDTETDDRKPAVGLSISGVLAYDPDDSDSLVDPLWFPEERFLQSLAVDAAKAAEQRADAARREVEREFLAYVGVFGVASLVAKFPSADLRSAPLCIVGFDSGDSAVVDGGEPEVWE